VGLKIELTREEQEILEGKKGEALRKAMKSVVLYGEAFGAQKLVPLDGPVHLVTSFGITILEPVFEMMEELIKSGLKAELPFTADPRPLDYKNVKCSLLEKLVFKIMYGKQKEYEEQLKAAGLKNNNAFTCTCYLNEVGNTPSKGDILAWAESSAVVYANSVLGARTNRNSGIIELLSGIIGKTPYFGLLTDEGRKAGWLVELKTTCLPDAQALGSAIGMKVMDGVPYIAGLDRFTGSIEKESTRDYLKDMGAASASNGAVGVYQVENITPEAVDAGRSLLADGYKTYIIDDAVIEAVIRSYPVMWKNPDAAPEICFIGCPHLSLYQIHEWIDKIKTELNGGKLKIRTILCAAPDVVEKFSKDTEALQYLKSTGASITSICPLMYMNNPICSKHAVITNSNKLRTYTASRYYTDDRILQLITKGGIS
jgi:hypothetical protein